jgi:endonuclease/exonuclease/phosphatase (EEP) superfamily protein YafD
VRESKTGCFGYAALGTILLYATVVTGWTIAYRIIGDGFWALAMVNAFAVYLFTPLPLVTTLGILARHRTAWIAIAGVTLQFFGLFGRYLLPPFPTVRAESGSPYLRVMTYNVLFTSADATPIANSITGADADIVAFQEFTPHLAHQLEQKVGADYAYRTPLPVGCSAGVVIWSRYPLQVESVDRDVACRVSSAIIDLDGTRVRVVGIHGWPYRGLDRESVERSFQWRREQIEWVLDRTQEQPEPLIIMGDLNATPTHEVHHLLSTHLSDAFREAGWGLGHTYPASGEFLWGIHQFSRLVRIDHIFHSEQWRAEAAWVGEWDGSSDHLPVIAQLRLTPDH